MMEMPTAACANCLAPPCKSANAIAMPQMKIDMIEIEYATGPVSESVMRDKIFSQALTPLLGQKPLKTRELFL